MQENKDILILYDSRVFTPADFQKKGVKAGNTFRKVSLPLRILRRLFKLLNLSQVFWYEEWKNFLPDLKIVILFAPVELSEIKFIKKSNRNIRIIYWYWNPVFRYGLPSEKVKKLVDIWTFDPEDAKNYKFRFNTTFYFNNISLRKNYIEIDTLFVGTNKGRRPYLGFLKDLLNKNQITSYFYIVPDKNEKTKEGKPEICYIDYLDLLSKSKAIIDLKPDGQSGLTVRPMESIFFEKKLITNDVSISFEDFYHPQNIFIVGKDNEKKLREFLDSPYKRLSKALVDKYDFRNWLERFNN